MFLEENMAKLLGLKPIGSDSLETQGIGNVLHAKVKYNKYLLKLKSIKGDQTVQIPVYGIEKVCSVFQTMEPELNQELLKWGIDVSETQIDGENINLLIGGDIYWDLINGNIVRTDIGIVGIPTCLGWTIQGRKDSIDQSVNIVKMKVTTV